MNQQQIEDGNYTAEDFLLSPDAEETLQRMEDEANEQSLAELYKSVCLNEDIILVIDLGSEEMLRKGLTAIKYKTNKAAKDAGEPVDQRSLEFRMLDWTAAEKAEDADWPKKVKVQVWLKAKQSIRVHRMIITDKEF